MAEFEIECNECGWQGMESALDSHADESGREDDFSFCPDCGSTDFEKITEQE
jgi:Zn finger protein HypA/HybF involved in hydrogenase expression